MNIADLFSQKAKQLPQKTAVVFSKKKASINFETLEGLANSYARGLVSLGLKKGDKVLLFVRPSLKFHALVFSLFKAGAVPVLIDPGMGIKNLLVAIKEVSPQIMIAEPIVHLLSFFFKKTFSSLKIKITTGSSLQHLEKFPKEFYSTHFDENEMAAILFTSGGTGRPKGVVYTHKIFYEQTRILKELFSLNEKEIDLPGFPLFSLFTLTMGMTSCIPDMDPSKPAKANPEKLLKNILDYQVSFVAGSPAIWEKLANLCLEKKITLPSIKYLVMFGAPVRTELHEKFQKILPNGTTYTPYGATESLPVSNISGKEILTFTASLTAQGKGTCVGKPVPGIKIAIVPVFDGKIPEMSLPPPMNHGEIGEVIVSGAIVTRDYYNAPIETELAKIFDGKSFWHRIGDMGYLDKEGRLWFCGRKSHRAETSNGTLYSVNTEAIFNAHPGVSKSALVALGNKGKQNVAIVIERNALGKMMSKEKLIFELLDLGQKHPHTAGIRKIYFCDHFPVDVRHNIKIDRLELARRVQEGIL